SMSHRVTRLPPPSPLFPYTTLFRSALGVPAVGSAVTYRAENYAEFSATSLLGTVRQNSGMFADIQGAARAATPYVQNLLLLSDRSEEHTSELQSRENLVCRLLLEKK